MLLKFQPNFIKFPRNSIYAAVSLRVHRVLCETCSFKELFHSLPIVGLLTKDKEIGNVSIKTFTIESESKHALLQHHWNHNFFSTSQYRWPWLIPKNFQSVDFVDFGRNFPSGGFVSLSQSPLQRHSSSYSTSSSQSQLMINYILLWCVLFHPDSIFFLILNQIGGSLYQHGVVCTREGWTESWGWRWLSSCKDHSDDDVCTWWSSPG